MMDKPDRSTDHDLGERLRSGDPAGDGSEPSADEWVAMRRRMLLAAIRAGKARTGARARAWAWTAAAAAAVLIALLVGPELIDLGDRDGPPQVTERGAPVPPARDPGSASEGDRRPLALQFTTKSGIRVIWTLDPGFEPPAALLAGGSGEGPDQHSPDGQGS